VRNPEAARAETVSGAFVSSALPIAELAEAIEIVSPVPCAVAHGVVEIWPLEEAR
jgi:hypothetical protein